MAAYMDLIPGWLPISLLRGPRLPQAIWLQFSSTKLTEPFLQQTIARLMSERPSAERVTDLDESLRVSDGLPEVRPAGLIFHISRCGSTLVTNMLKLVSGVTCVSEAPLVNLLLYGSAAHACACPVENWPSRQSISFAGVGESLRMLSYRLPRSGSHQI
jgi:hypothetical protein